MLTAENANCFSHLFSVHFQKLGLLLYGSGLVNPDEIEKILGLGETGVKRRTDDEQTTETGLSGKITCQVPEHG